MNLQLLQKAGSESLLCDETPDICIKVADSFEYILAHSAVLCLLSQVVKHLPRAAVGPTIWDLSQVILEGESEPVKGSVVELWLDCIYARVDSSRHAKPPSNLGDAKPLLFFADYTGTAKAGFNELVDAMLQDPNLCLTVPVCEGRSVEVLLSGRMYHTVHGELIYTDLPCGSSGDLVALSAEDFAPHKEAFGAALCAALEEWLYLAGRLQLVPLIRLLLAFIKTQLVPRRLSVCLPYISTAFSPRALRAMPAELVFEGFLHHCLGRRTNDAFITAPQARVELLSQESVAWFGDASGSGVARSIELLPGREGAHLKADNVVLPIYASLGGPSDQKRDSIMQEALGRLVLSG